MTAEKSEKNAATLSHKAHTEAILESISDGVFTVDENWRITSFNRSAEKITGILREEAIGSPCSDVFRSSMCENDCALRHTLDTGKPVINKSCFIVDAAGNRIPISVSTAVLRDADGRIVGGAETFRDLSEVEALRQELDGNVRIGDMISCSPAMHKIFGILPAVAASTSTVLIQGATGTGKELVAGAIHNLSDRRDHPFVAVNCGALPDTLLESELFGYKAGAFTGAGRDKPGRFALAEGGTLFLDEIGEISPALQVRLLRVLQEKVYEPLGGTDSVAADVRIITATNRDLAAMVKQGDFREDLFYRIHVVCINLPPLAERKEDIPLLVEHFITRFNRIQGKSVAGVTPEALTQLMAHDWPGNVRELENLIERIFVMHREGLITPAHLPDDFTADAPQATPDSDTSENTMETLKKTVEAQTIQDALKRNRYNRLATARELGIHKSTLFRKIKALGISLPERDGRSAD
jgi:PAS domain S-box-containing protein